MRDTYDAYLANPTFPRWFEQQRAYDERTLGHVVTSLGNGHVRCTRCGCETWYERRSHYGFPGVCGRPEYAPAWIEPRPRYPYHIVDDEVIELVPEGRTIDRWGVISGRKPGHPPQKQEGK